MYPIYNFDSVADLEEYINELRKNYVLNSWFVKDKYYGHLEDPTDQDIACIYEVLRIKERKTLDKQNKT